MGNKSVIMTGEAGEDASHRWEGTALAGPFEVPKRGECYVICWHTWTGPKEALSIQPNQWADIRDTASIIFLD